MCLAFPVLQHVDIQDHRRLAWGAPWLPGSTVPQTPRTTNCSPGVRLGFPVTLRLDTQDHFGWPGLRIGFLVLRCLDTQNH